jgi:hypothetical protein
MQEQAGQSGVTCQIFLGSPCTVRVPVRRSSRLLLEDNTGPKIVWLAPIGSKQSTLNLAPLQGASHLGPYPGLKTWANLSSHCVAKRTSRSINPRTIIAPDATCASYANAPNAKRQTPNAKRQTPNAKRQTPNAKRQTGTLGAISNPVRFWSGPGCSLRKNAPVLEALPDEAPKVFDDGA